MLIRGVGQDLEVTGDSKHVLSKKHFPSVKKGDACVLWFDQEEDALLVSVVAEGCEVVLASGEKNPVAASSKVFLQAGDSFGFGGVFASVLSSRSKRSKAEPFHAIAVGSLKVPAVALGTLQLGVNYPKERMSRADAIALVRASYAGGVRLFDTSDAYCKNGSEMVCFSISVLLNLSSWLGIC